MKRLQKKPISLLLLLLSPVPGTVAASNPFGIWFAAVLSSAALGIALVMLPYYAAVCPALLSLAGGWLLYGPYGAAIAFIASVPAGVCLAFCFKKKKSLPFTIAAMSVSCVYMLAALLAVYIYRRGGGLDYAALQKVIQPLNVHIRTIIDNAVKLMRVLAEQSSSRISIDAELLKKTVTEQFIYIVPGYVISLVFIVSFFAAMAAKKLIPPLAGADASFWDDFVAFRIPRPIAYFYLLFILIVAIERLSGDIDDNIAYHTISNLITVMNLFFFTVGVSTIYKFFARKQSYWAVRYLILAAVLLFSLLLQSSCTMAVVFVGLYDTLFFVRNIPFKKK